MEKTFRITLNDKILIDLKTSGDEDYISEFGKTMTETCGIFDGIREFIRKYLEKLSNEEFYTKRT